MTLRRRLLLVYLVIVVLSCVTGGIAVNELLYSRQVVDDLERWQDIMLNVERLRTAFARELLLRPTSRAVTPSEPEPDEEELEQSFTVLIGRIRKVYRPYPDFLNAHVTMSKLQEYYNEWRRLWPGNGPKAEEQTRLVQASLRFLTDQIDNQRKSLTKSAHTQNQRTLTLLIAVVALTIIHLAVVGAILRRSLLRPMERLGRQVAALGRDAPPPEPLLDSPAELADLAEALEHARVSLDEYRRRLVESERLTAIGQLAAQLAHNLRNPLASIRAAAQIAGRQGNVDDYARKRLDEIVAATDRLTRWVTGLTEFARPQIAPMEPRDLAPLLEQVRESVTAELAAKDLRIEVVVPPDGLMIPHEPSSLEQAVFAAVMNAIEASPVGGTIRLQAEWHRDESPPYCCLRVTDSGAGLPEGPPEQVFESHFTTKPAGMGLGLALARQAVRRHGGIVTARANPEGGAIIEFRLPGGPTDAASETPISWH